MVTVYFTPSVELLAMECGATPCEKPEAAGDFALIVGDDRAWKHTFQGILSNVDQAEGKRPTVVTQNKSLGEILP